MSEKNVFKKIIDRELPANIVYEDEWCLAFHDIQPQARVHLLLIPKKELANLVEAGDGDQNLLGHLMLTIPKLARQEGIEDGFRVVSNNGAPAGQEVFHLHFHIMGGGPVPAKPAD